NRQPPIRPHARSKDERDPAVRDAARVPKHPVAAEAMHVKPCANRGQNHRSDCACGQPEQRAAHSGRPALVGSLR
ncbi:MAG: hypothetical protein ACPL7K_10210, partial [Armatimonadota bacterium]